MAIFICTQGNDDAFGSVGVTLLKSVMMTIGELDFNENFIDQDVYYPFLYCFWIVFVIVMPVLFNNLLVRMHFINLYTCIRYFIDTLLALEA